MHSAINYFRSENGLTSPIPIRLYTVHFNLLLLEGKQLVIVFLKMTGTSFFDMFWCFRIQSHALTLLHIQYTLIVERTCLIMIRLTATSFVSKHHICLKVLAIDFTLDKRSWHIREQPLIFFYIHIKKYICVLWDPVVNSDLLCLVR